MSTANVSRMLTIPELRILFSGGVVELDGYGSITLQDLESFEFVDLLNVTASAVATAGRSRSTTPLISFFQSRDKTWNTWCVEHAWTANGTVIDTAEKLGIHVREKHGDSSISDMKDFAVAMMQGLTGLIAFGERNRT